MKWQRILLLIGLVGVSLSFLGGTARADDAAMGAIGSSVMPLQNDQITMAAERVDAAIHDRQASVTCVFTFTNSGPPTTVLMGFPQMVAERGSPELLDFTAKVDGKAVATSF